jgi:hypothetical protein
MTELASAWPSLKGYEEKLEHILFAYSDMDFRIMLSFLMDVTRNPVAGRMLRQINVAGMHTKWPERRTRDIKTIYSLATGRIAEGDIYSMLGLKRSPVYVSMRVLCPELRRSYTAGLRELAISIDDLSSMSWRPPRCLIVENDQTFHALDDQDGLIVILGRGNGVGMLKAIPWRPMRTLYWGDLDTHGFSILNEARAAFPEARSVLMDEETLMKYIDFWVEEESQNAAVDGTPRAERLLPHELAVYQGLLNGTFASRRNDSSAPKNVRLEQERIEWTFANKVLASAWDQE